MNRFGEAFLSAKSVQSLRNHAFGKCRLELSAIGMDRRLCGQAAESITNKRLRETAAEGSRSPLEGGDGEALATGCTIVVRLRGRRGLGRTDSLARLNREVSSFADARDA